MFSRASETELLINQISLIRRALDYVRNDEWVTSNLTYLQFRRLYTAGSAFEDPVTARSGIRSAINEDEPTLAVDESDYTNQPRLLVAVPFRRRFFPGFCALFHPGATRLHASKREKDAGRDPSTGGSPAKGCQRQIERPKAEVVAKCLHHCDLSVDIRLGKLECVFDEIESRLSLLNDDLHDIEAE